MAIELSEKQIKDGWQIVKFGEIAKQCKESVDRENNPFERYVEGGHMDTENLRITRWGEFGDHYVGPAFHRIFRKGQILYGSRRTYLKKVAVAEFDGITANTTFVIEPQKPEILLPGLLPFLMLSEDFTNHSVLNSKGSTNPYINWGDIAKYEFPLPPIERQKEILEVLVKASAINPKVESLKTSSQKLFRKLLVDLIWKKQEIWKKRQVGELGKVQMGRQRAPKYTTGKHTRKYLRVVNVLDGYFSFTDVEEMDFDDRDYPKYNLKKDDLLLTEGDIVSTYNVGRCAIWNEEIPDCCFQNTLIRFQSGPSILPKFANYLFRAAFYKGVFAGASNMTTVAHLGSTRFSKIKLGVPSIDEQLQIIETLDSVSSVCDNLRLKGITRSQLDSTLRNSILRGVQ